MTPFRIYLLETRAQKDEIQKIIYNFQPNLRQLFSSSRDSSLVALQREKQKESLESIEEEDLRNTRLCANCSHFHQPIVARSFVKWSTVSNAQKQKILEVQLQLIVYDTIIAAKEKKQQLTTSNSDIELNTIISRHFHYFHTMCTYDPKRNIIAHPTAQHIRKVIYILVDDVVSFFGAHRVSIATMRRELPE